MVEKSEQSDPEASGGEATRRLRTRARSHWKAFVLLVSAIIAIAALLFGQGILLRPQIAISCGAIDLRIPPRLMMQNMMMQLFMYSEDAKDTIADNMGKNLREYGMSPDKIDMVLNEWRKEGEGTISFTGLPLESHEKTMLWSAFVEAQQGVAEHFGDKARMPDAVLFFEVANSGRTSAKNVHIVVRLAGAPYESKLDSDNKVVSTDVSTGQFLCDLESISPGSTTRGIVWFNKSGRQVSLEQNQIVVTYDQGTARRQFAVDKFYLSKN